jgi:hypothetical protein
VTDQVPHPNKTSKIVVVYIFILHFWIANGKTKDSEQHGSKHSMNLVYFGFLCECNFDLLLSFPNVWTLPHFLRIY